MIEQTLAIIRNTFFESVRQPIVLVLLVVATLALIVANLTSGFTMADDQKMLVDIGLATIFIFGALLAAFIATNVLTREIENRTVLTVVSKPVGRPLFVVGKYLGVALAILVASLYMTFVFLLVEHHGVLQTVRDPIHAPVIIFGVAAAVISAGVGVWCNYFYGKVFASTVICTATPLAGLAYFLALFFDPHFGGASFSKGFDVNLWAAIFALIMANLVLTAVAIALSTRLGQIMTVILTISIFLGGLLSDWFFGQQMFRPMETLALQRAEANGDIARVEVHKLIHRVGGEQMLDKAEVHVIADEGFNRLTALDLANLEAGEATLADLGLVKAGGSVIWEHLNTFGEKAMYFGGRVGHSIVPNFQVLWLSDAVTQEHVIPGSYLMKVLIYGLLCIVAALSLAVILFQRREVG